MPMVVWTWEEPRCFSVGVSVTDLYGLPHTPPHTTPAHPSPTLHTPLPHLMEDACVCITPHTCVIDPSPLPPCPLPHTPTDRPSPPPCHCHHHHPTCLHEHTHNTHTHTQSHTRRNLVPWEGDRNNCLYRLEQVGGDHGGVFYVSLSWCAVVNWEG